MSRFDDKATVYRNGKVYFQIELPNRKSLREEGEEMVKELKRRREEDELYNRKLLEEGAATRTLLVIAAGHPDPVRLAKEVLRSKIGVTEEVLDSPMWKVSEDA